MINLAEQIGAIPLFEGLPEDQQADLAAIAQVKNLERNEVIFSEGDEGNGFYVVSAGRVKIFKLSPDGKEQILHLFGPGEPFGEVAVFAGVRFPAYAEALDKAAVIFFPRRALLDLIRRNPDLALNLLGLMSMRLRRFTHLIEDLSLKEVPGRLAAHLLFLSGLKNGSDELELDITKTQLASLLGTIPETLSRILAKLVKQGLLKSEGPA